MFLKEKNLLLTLMALLLFACSPDGSNEEILPDDEVLASCSDNVQNGDETGVDCGGSCSNDCIDPSILNGSLNTELELDASITYTLTGSYILETGATLIIPEGTRIIAEPGNTYILVKQGADLVITGSIDNPVIITTPEDEDEPWGGIILAGNSTTSLGENITKTIGSTSFNYGGEELSENSGSLQYLILKNTGSLANYDLGALSLFAVGSGTTVRNVAFFNSKSSGLTYYGGTVSTANLYFENNSLAIKLHEGWGGSQTYSYLASDESFTALLMATGPNGNPNFDKFTAKTTQTNIAFMFGDQSGANINDLSLDGFSPSFQLLDDVIESNILIDGDNVDTDRSYDEASTVDPNDFNWVGDRIMLP